MPSTVGAIRILKKIGDIFRYEAALVGGYHLIFHKDKISPIVMGVLGGLQSLEVDWLKKTFPKMRPNGINDKSFASGHAAGAFLAFGFAWGAHGIKHPITLSSFVLASLVGLSRYLVKKHWLTDVAIGAIIGSVHGYLAAHSRDVYTWIRKKNETD